MKRAIYIFSVLFFMFVLFLACSEDSNPLPSKSHTEGWTDVTSEDFHGTKVLANGTESCKTCHGKNFEGGDSDISCFKCHESYPHTNEWLANSDFSHNNYLKAQSWDVESCKECHGDNFQGGKSKVACYTCHTFPHSADWLVTSSTDFHGTFVKNKDYDTNACANCHGVDFKGGDTDVSCYTCHDGYPHNKDWLVASSVNFHGSFLKDNDFATNSCANCHGEDFKGGDTDVSCYTCHTFPHNTDWLVPSSENFHGTFVKNNDYDTNSCAVCHGTDFQGGKTGVSCYTCHEGFPHPSGWISPADENFHGQSIRKANWSLESCKGCHGDDYKGGSTGTSCFTCHTGDKGPESCNTCHGNEDNFAPPQDLSNNTETTAIGVGAHQFHVTSFGGCAICHTEPSSVDDAGHIDDTPHAEVLDAWAWDRTTATCTSSCHTDANKTYIWNDF